MPYLFITTVYPSHKSDEVVKKYLEITPKYPPQPSLGKSVADATKIGEQGARNITVYEVEKGKLEEAISLWTKGVAEFRNIEGYEASIDVWMTTAEAFKAIGMKVPE